MNWFYFAFYLKMYLYLNSVHLFFEFVIHSSGTKFKSTKEIDILKNYEVHNSFMNLPIMNGQRHK